MSGHSKWSTIKHKKAAADQKRADVFSKLARAVTIAARQGGGDLETNYMLRTAVEKAKAANMPKGNIERAIKKGTGELVGEQLEELLMEAYGPGGVALLIEAVSDNRNRTTSEIKHILIKTHGKPASEGSVRWMFDHKFAARVRRAAISDIEAFELSAIDAGADDIYWVDEGAVVYIHPDRRQELMAGLARSGYGDIESSLEWVAKEAVALSNDDGTRLEKLFEALNENDDVQEIYSNAR
jgi:YebC/PmpR family DNA-binding regulatory protein